MGRWVSSSLSHKCRLATNLASGGPHFTVIHTKNARNSSVVGRPGLSFLSGGCCFVFTPCSRTHYTTSSGKWSNVGCAITHPLQQSHHSALPSVAVYHNKATAYPLCRYGVSKPLTSTKKRGFQGVRWCPRGGGGGGHHKSVPEYSVNQLQHLRCLVKIWCRVFPMLSRPG